jgi:hypothetical protein
MMAFDVPLQLLRCGVDFGDNSGDNSGKAQREKQSE